MPLVLLITSNSKLWLNSADSHLAAQLQSKRKLRLPFFLTLLFDKDLIMQTTSPTIKLQLKHTSVRQYQNTPIDQALLEQIVSAGQAAATSSFIQACSVVRVTEPDVRQSIAEAAGGQRWVEDAPEFLVFCADMYRVNMACVQADQGELEGYSEHSLAAIVDVALFAQNVMLAAESVGLGGVYIGGIRNDPQRVSDLLLLPHRVIPVFGMCLGYPATDTEVKPRMPVELVLHQDRYQPATEADLHTYDNQMAAYYQSRSSNVRISDWTSVTANATQGKKREHMAEFLNRKGFFKR